MAKCKKCGHGGLMQKLSANGLCLSCMQAEIDNLNGMLTPEMKDAEKLKSTIESRSKDLQTLCDQVKSKEAVLASLESNERDLSKKILVAEDAIELESFSLYVPKYDFVNSDIYKEKLDEIRVSQKSMIRSGTAAICEIQWTVDGSKAKGRKMSNDTIKLLLRSFNNECDMAVAAVRFNNFDRCEARIDKAFSTLNKLGQSNRIHLAQKYYALKLDELHLAYEYQCKKQEEKERLRALREQQREEAKLAKEIEAARKEAEKEKKHYQQALTKLQAQYTACEAEDERAALEEKKNELIGHLDDISARLEDIDYRQSNQKAGYVYVISNIGSFGEGVYKIGMTRRLDPTERVYELGDASVPFVFDIHAMIFSDDAPKLEAALHRAFADRRVNMVNTRREYFRVSLDEIKAVVLENHDKTVEFIETPDAQQYRETTLMQKGS